ncbi:MAG: hypothetical protein JWN31_1911 [Frankiales bacterium]|nr:hypothetical protein [Frankiales bacterium]
MAELPSERHAFQLGSLVIGLLVMAVALLFLVNDQGVVDVDQAVAGAALLVVVAAASIVRAVVRLLGRRG